MSTKIDELFATLAALLADQTRDLAMAMDELRAAEAERDNARQSLRAAEQDLAEIDTLCNDFRRANARLVADLAAAMERLNHAESILMQ
jgi:septal ring factor EnvC (AmiA/AmiB activator)